MRRDILNIKIFYLPFKSKSSIYCNSNAIALFTILVMTIITKTLI